MRKLLLFFASMFKPVSRTSELENYIAARNPKSVAEVERLVTEFNQSVGGRHLWSI